METSAVMTPALPYKQVGKAAGLKKQKVKEVAEAMMEVLAKHVKSVGSFKVAGAINMTLEQKPATASKPASQTVRVEALKQRCTWRH